MNDEPRLRMFAGANGSGKSTLKSVINPALLGVYINPDDIEREIKEFGFLNLAAYAEITDGQEPEMKTEYMTDWFKTALWDKF